MDQALNREEKDTLCELLGIPRKCYGNYPLMKSSFRQACLKFHPDKGGDEALMQRLNSLWQRFQQAVYQLRRDLASSFEVSACFWECPAPTLEERMKWGFKALFWKGPCCFLKSSLHSRCNCICCRLHRQHFSIKLLRNKRCLVWGECLCLSCFLLYFGFPPTWECIEEWQKVILHTDFSLLHLQLY
ncbi:small tumor antigen [Eptesicus serotinus polyomavirus 1]|uniref:Small tumor antigen n=1 Tax=Eptesicus serotinus polyomavirus 1 TaxID=2990647 RepID=A0AAE9P8B3_9POLY|nr:small tumor antigen [Eptesicus serotinus polyomavirus 1]